MDIHYLEGILNRAKAMDADVVKVDIEEFESALYCLKEYCKYKYEIEHCQAILKKQTDTVKTLLDIQEKLSNLRKEIEE